MRGSHDPLFIFLRTHNENILTAIETGNPVNLENGKQKGILCILNFSGQDIYIEGQLQRKC